MRIRLLTGVAALVLGTAGAAFATPTVSASTYPSANFGLVNLGSGYATGQVASYTSGFSADGETFTWGSASPGSGVYAGDATGVARSPLRADLTQGYLAVEPGAPMTISFATSQTAFNMIWGSLDKYNSLTFNPSDGGSAETYTGSQILAAIGGTAGLTDAAVSFSGLDPFQTVTITSTTPAFEFDPGIPVPEPASMAMLGMGLLGLGLARRRRNRT